MVLGDQGNHESVFQVEGVKSLMSANRPIILNGMLAYMHSLVMQKDRLYIQNIILGSFDVAAIKGAREVLFKCLSKEKYTYQGPRGKTSDRDKQVHAFDGLYEKMSMLKKDDSVNIPIFAIPSDQLSSILVLAQKVNHVPCEDRFNRLETDLLELKKSFQTVANSIRPNQAVVPPPITVPVSTASAIPLEVRSRLNSTGSFKRARTSEEVVDISGEYDFCLSGDDEPFVFPSAHRRKAARTTRNQNNLSTQRARSDDTNRFQAGNKGRMPVNKDWRRGMVWGKNNSQPGSSFGAKVPEIFVSMCDSNTTEDAIKKYLLNEQINVTNVRKVSHDKAWYKSFVVTVSKREDYDKMLTGYHVPQEVGVKRYYPPRSADGVRSSGGMSSWYKNTYKPLEEIEMETFDSLPVTSDVQLQQDSTPSPSQMTEEEKTARSMATALDMPGDADSRKPNIDP